MHDESVNALSASPRKAGRLTHRLHMITVPLGHLPHNSHIFWVDPLKIVHTLCLEFHYDLCLVLPGDTCVSYGRLCFIRGFAMLFPKNYFMAPRTYSYLHSVFWLSHTVAHPFPIHT